jgi:hypothetical protein
MNEGIRSRPGDPEKHGGAGDDADMPPPDVESDRSAPGGPAIRPLPIEEIEEEEHDSMGG